MKQLSPKAELEAIRKKLKHFSTEAKPKAYLDTGNTELNTVLGDPKRGMPYGKLMELSGMESNGKSALALDLLALSQEDNAVAIWLDAEQSFDEKWAAKRGVNIGDLRLISPYVGKFGKDKKSRLVTAQEMCQEAEEVINLHHERSPDSKLFMVVDSVTALLTREEAEAGLTEQNMRTKMSLSQFLGQLLRRWVGMAQSMNATILFVNQMRINPMQRFGNPEYQPGGKSLKFYCHSRVIMRRVKGGRLMKAGKQFGIKGYLKNIKNKVGGIEFSEVGYKILFSGSTEFLPVAQVKKDEE